MPTKPQPKPTDWTPTRKITAAAVGGALAVLATWAAQEFAHITITAEAGGAISTLGALIAGYWITER